MRKVFSVALMAAMVCLGGIAKDAGATVTFSLIWTATTGTGIVGTNAIDAAGGDILSLSLQMTTDQTLSIHAMSINFDTDLGNELNLFTPGGFREWAGSTFGSVTMATTYASLNAGVGPPPAVESGTGGPAGSIILIESAQLIGPLFLPVGTYTIGTGKFQVNAGVTTDGNDLFTGLFGGGDGVGDNLLTLIPSSNLVFNGAAVNGAAIPEPGTVSLLGLGLVGLVLAGRRARL